jgi:enoyl-CoA hydratase
MSNDLIVDQRDAVVTLCVNRPEVRNALNLSLMQRIADTLDERARDPSVRVFVLTGSGDRVFISGADVGEFREHLSTAEKALKYDEAAERLQTVLRRVPQPVIAMIQGHAIGSGTIVAASCDFRIAVKAAKFGIPVAKFGFVAPVPDILRLVQLVGPAKAKWLMMTGTLIEAPQAVDIGLIDQYVEPGDLKATVDMLAATLAANAPLTIKSTKEIIEAMSAPKQTVRDGSPWYDEIFSSRDFQEGLDAFFNKRKPIFRGK